MRMCEPQANFPSSEEISFKLTQNLIPSFTNSKGTLIPLESSLEYTYSRISIQNMLMEEPSKDQVARGDHREALERIEAEAFSKNSSLKASSVRTSAESDIKHTPRTSFRERVVSRKKPTRQTSLQKGSSFQVFEFEKTTPKASLIHCQPRKSKSEIRKKSYSIRRENTLAGSLSDVKTLPRTQSRKNCEEQDLLVDLKKSMHIKQIKLRADQERERNYMKRILQNRMCSIHSIEDMTHSTPLWTSRKGSTRN